MVSANQERVQLVVTESLGITPGVKALKAVLMSVVEVVKSVVTADQMEIWARTERVRWYEDQAHRPTPPEWYGGFR